MFRLFLVIACIVVGCLFNLVPVAHGQSMKPGLWKATSSFKLNGIPLPASENEDCISAGDAKDAKSAITKGLKKNGCELTKWSLKGQAFAAAVSCKTDDIKASGSVNGTVSSEKYSLTGEIDGSFKSIPAQATLVLDGKWIKSCSK